MNFTLADGKMSFSAGGSSSDSSGLQLETSTTVGVTVPAGDPSGGSSGEQSGDLFDGGTGDGSELLTIVGTSSDSLITGNSVGKDGELMSSSEGGQDGEKGSRRRDHCWCCVGVLTHATQSLTTIYTSDPLLGSYWHLSYKHYQLYKYNLSIYGNSNYGKQIGNNEL